MNILHKEYLVAISYWVKLRVKYWDAFIVEDSFDCGYLVSGILSLRVAPKWMSSRCFDEFCRENARDQLQTQQRNVLEGAGRGFS